MTPKPQAIKGKIDKLDFIKNLKICASKYIIKKVKRQATIWEKIFANHVLDKGLAPRIRKELLQLKNIKRNNIIKKSKRFK